MSSKAKALFKRLRSKAIEERERERNETPEPVPVLRQVGTFTVPERVKYSSVPKNLKREDEDIDPLEYFQKDRIKIEPSDMKEYSTKKDIEAKEKMKNKIEINPKTGMMGPTSHKINFMDMLKARNKIKKMDGSGNPLNPLAPDGKKNERNNLSMENRKPIKEENDEDDEMEERNRSAVKREIDSTQNFYVKLILARNRFNQKNVNEDNVYQNILTLVDELNSIKDLPIEYANQINDLLMKLELPQHLIVDNDVQDYVPEEQFVPLITNPMPLDQAIKKLNLSDN